MSVSTNPPQDTVESWSVRRIGLHRASVPGRRPARPTRRRRNSVRTVARKLTAVVDTIRTSDGDAPEGALKAAEALSSSTPGTRKTYIYIGTLADLQAKGAGIEGWVSETSAPTGQEAWRAALETQVLSSECCRSASLDSSGNAGRAASTTL